jgi:cobalamin biosynthesis Co2+ chelatase CbiK
MALKAKEFTMTFDEMTETFSQSVSDRFKKLEVGSAVLWFKEDFYAAIWIGRNKISLMLNKEEINGFVFLCTASDKKE